MFGVFLFLTFYMQQDLGLSPLTTGVAFLPMTAVIVVTSTTVQTRVLPRTGAKPLIAAQLNSVAPMIELIRRTDLAGIIAESAVAQSAELRVIPLEDPTPIRTPGMLWPKGATRSPVLKHFAEIIRRAAGAAA